MFWPRRVAGGCGGGGCTSTGRRQGGSEQAAGSLAALHNRARSPAPPRRQMPRSRAPSAPVVTMLDSPRYVKAPVRPYFFSTCLARSMPDSVGAAMAGCARELRCTRQPRTATKPGKRP